MLDKRTLENCDSASANQARLELVERKQFIEQLFRQNYSEMIHLASVLLGDDEEAEDLVQDVFLRVADGDIPILAHHIADMRNFYTHYNSGRYVEPSYQEMFAATHVLRFVLLAIVYKTLGLSSETIIDARKRVEFQLYYKDIEAILHYANEQEKNS